MRCMYWTIAMTIGSFSTIDKKKKKHVSSLLRYGFSMDEINGALKQLHLDTVDDYDDGIDE